mmetsp:Transcript_68267/g.192468  ORF Transcript_68267/g.192468 Transcript_68267/m.192468 type:complete len:233 (+) Transcript_68267:798-1496(+)
MAPRSNPDTNIWNFCALHDRNAQPMLRAMTMMKIQVGSQVLMKPPRHTPNQQTMMAMIVVQMTIPARRPSNQNSTSLNRYPQKPMRQPVSSSRVATRDRRTHECLTEYSKETASHPMVPALLDSMSLTFAECDAAGHSPEATSFAASSVQLLTRSPTWSMPGSCVWLAKPLTRHSRLVTADSASSVVVQASLTMPSTDCHVGTMPLTAPSYFHWSFSSSSWSITRRRPNSDV